MSGRGGAIAGCVLMVGVALAVAACTVSSSPNRSQEQLAARGKLAQLESCAPVANPLIGVTPSLVHIDTPPDASGSFSSGTGIIIDQGWVLTNEHVVDAALTGTLKLFFFDQNGSYSVTSPGKVVASDPDLDLALVEADTGSLPSVMWGDEGKLQQGSELIGVGFGLGSPVPIPDAGRYLDTQVDRATGQAFIESDVQLDHGDSGGPMLNRCGQVIGINTARTRSAAGAPTIGLSIPGFNARSWAIHNRPQ